jgi:hypothetical protein
VEAGYTALALRISLAMGILSVITTGFWGGLSDRKGRTLILRMSILGLTIGDLTYIALGLFPQSSVPLGKNLLVVGAAIEGMLGGLATLTAAHLAYIADVTPNGTRATVFSFFTGLFFFGIALGPGLGGLVVKWLHSTMAPFYFALGAHLSYFIFAALFLPESSSPERMTKAQEEHRDANAAFFTGSEGLSVTSAYMRLLLSYITLPLRPLRLLAPQKRKKGSPGQQQNSESSTPSPSQFGPILPASSTAPITVEATTAATSISAEEGDEVNATHISVSHAPADALDWNLTFAAFAYFLEASSLGIMTPKLNYAMYKFNWDASQIGYFLSFSSLVRVACLIVIIPLFVKWAHPPNRQTSLPQDGRDHTHDDLGDETPLLNEEGRPLLDAVGNNDRSYGAFGQQDVAAEDEIVSDPDYQFDGHAEHIERLWTTRALHLRQIRDSRFDQKLTLGSIAIAASAYLLLALTSNAGPIPFVALSAFISLGGAASAALSSLALAMLNNDNDSGKFFAAWSVLSAISQTIFGPVIFSALFVRTVAVAPQAIFVLGFGECSCRGLCGDTFFRLTSLAQHSLSELLSWSQSFAFVIPGRFHLCRLVLIRLPVSQPCTIVPNTVQTVPPDLLKAVEAVSECV